jgi:cytochrome c553
MRRALMWAAAMAVSAGWSGTVARADPPEERIQQCAACHGENGVPNDPSVPAIWGQQSGYIYIQLRDYKNKLRVHEFMNSVTADMTKADMQELAEYYSQKDWVNQKQSPAPKDVASHAETISGSGQCPQCHLGGYLGDGVIPRLSGQTYDYLKSTMLAFRTKQRANNPWMSDLLKTFSEDDIDALAKYLSGL